MEKKYGLALLLVFLFQCVIYSQETKPQWLMPLYFEDANGDKDTVYIGYDTAASDQVSDIDTIFNEGWIKIDTTKFNVFLWGYPGHTPEGSYILTSDSVRKTDISSFPYPYANIGFTKGKMPIKLKWVDSLLHSPKLPFPDISPRPRARIDFYCSSAEPGYCDCPIEYDPLTLTDYPTSDIKFPVTDSIIFEGSGNDYYSPHRALINIFAQVLPHNFILDAINEPENKYYSVFPNPFTDYFNITNPYFEKLDITLLTTAGQTIFHTITSQSLLTINSSSLKEGIYFLRISTFKRFYTNKLIKMI
jgi:hypothetical protein